MPAGRVGFAELTDDEPVMRKPGAERRLLSVVVPLLNEEATLEQLYEELEKALAGGASTGRSSSSTTARPTARIASSCGSTRRTSTSASCACAGTSARRRRSRRESRSRAGEVIVTMDADLQDDPAEIPNLLAKLDDGFDVVSGWKCDRHDPFVRRFVSRIYNTATRLATGVKLHDMNCGLKAYRAEVFEHVRLYGERHRFVPVLAHHLGFSVTELPVNHRPRANGRSRFGIERYLRAPFDLLTIVFMGRYRHRPLHLFGGVGLIASSSASRSSRYLTVIKIGGAAIGDRPLLLLGVLLVVVGIQLLSLGLIGEMLTSHHEEKVAGDASRPRARARRAALSAATGG